MTKHADFSISTLLKDTWYFFTTHFIGLCAVLLPLLIPLNLISMAAGFYSNDEAQIIWPALILELIAFPIYQGALIFFLAAVIKDEHQNVSQYYRQSMKFWLPLLVLYLLMGLAIMGGCMLLILPGLIVAARVAFAEFYCLLHEEAPLDAFKSSWEQSREYQWKILGGLLVIALAIIIPFAVLERLVAAVGLNGTVYTFISNLLASIISACTTIFCFRVFTLHLDTQSSSGGEEVPAQGDALND